MSPQSTPFDPAIVKSYDIRGVYGEQFDDRFAYGLGRCLPQVVPADAVVVGHDARLGSAELAAALMAGFRDRGLDVTFLGMCPTECVYFEVGRQAPVGLGVMVTASHNPPGYNGFKVVNGDVRPVTGDSGLREAVDLVRRKGFEAPACPAEEPRCNVLPDFVKSMVDRVGGVRTDGLRVAVDASNGVAGPLWEVLSERLGLRPHMLNAEPDGHFPGHNPDPTKRENLEPLIETVMATSVDVGFIYDGDADRVVAVLGDGQVLGGSETTACLIESYAGTSEARFGLGMTISRATWDFCRKRGIEPVMLPVGHSKIKNVMREERDLVLAGESAGHYYYRDFHFSDSATLATLHLLQMAVQGQLGCLVGSLPGHWLSPEKLPVLQAAEKPQALEKARDLVSRVVTKMPDYREISVEMDARIHRNCAPDAIPVADGIRVDYEDWWFAVRPSGTEPIVRITLEANGRHLLERLLGQLPDEFSI